MKILITGGGTREPIDGVRFIANFSTGRTASELADFFASEGHEVVLILAENGVGPTDSRVRIVNYVTFEDLDASLARVLGEELFNLVVHLAAVADYSIAAVEIDGVPAARAQIRKLPSGSDVVLRLKPNYKIIDYLRDYARESNPKIVGFKLTRNPSESVRQEAIQKLASSPAVDLVVHNDLEEIERGERVFTVFSGADRIGTAADAAQLGRLLL